MTTEEKKPLVFNIDQFWSCRKCGHQERTPRGECKACKKQRASIYYQKNKQQVIKKTAEWAKNNPEKTRASKDKWVAQNPEKMKTAISNWAKENIESCRLKTQNYRARKHAGGRLSKNIAQKLYKLQRGKCACCGKPLGKNYHLDHRMPLALGGTNTDDNIQLLTALCNFQKNAKDPIEFMQSRGFLL